MIYGNTGYFLDISNICLNYLTRNYDYCYLRAMHRKNAELGADTIIVGSSHAMNGIIEEELTAGGDVIQFSVSSQDLFFDFENIKKAFRHAKRPIKRCMINLGYYMLYQDVSLSPKVRAMIPLVYMHLFGDNVTHNWPDPVKMDLFSNVSFDESRYPRKIMRELCEFWSEQVLMEQGSYYGSLCTREMANMLGVKKVVWSELSDEERREYAVNRVDNGHNKHIRHVETRRENGEILLNMVRFLAERHVKVYFFITPYTNYYMERIDPRYKTDIFETLDSLPYPVEFLDMNDYPGEFQNNDFLDTDHLNLAGAHKATALLNHYISMVEGI